MNAQVTRFTHNELEFRVETMEAGTCVYLGEHTDNAHSVAFHTDEATAIANAKAWSDRDLAETKKLLAEGF